MSKKVKSRRTDKQDSSDTATLKDLSEEADPPNRAVLAAIFAIRNEVIQIKTMYVTCRQTVCTKVRNELPITKK